MLLKDASAHVNCRPGFDRRDVLLVLSSVGFLAPAFWKSSSKDGVALASEFADSNFYIPLSVYLTFKC